jgi:hypothetical protein
MRSGALPRRPLVVAICLLVAALHLVTGPQYRGPFRTFITGYLIDLALPFAMVLLLGEGLATVRALRPAFVRAGLVVLVGVIVEGAQSLGVPLFGRTVDPLDVLAYAVGALAAVGFERLVFTDAGTPARRAWASRSRVARRTLSARRADEGVAVRVASAHRTVIRAG